MYTSRVISARLDQLIRKASALKANMQEQQSGDAIDPNRSSIYSHPYYDAFPAQDIAVPDSEEEIVSPEHPPVPEEEIPFIPRTLPRFDTRSWFDRIECDSVPADSGIGEFDLSPDRDEVEWDTSVIEPMVPLSLLPTTPQPLAVFPPLIPESAVPRSIPPPPEFVIAESRVPMVSQTLLELESFTPQSPTRRLPPAPLESPPHVFIPRIDTRWDETEVERLRDLKARGMTDKSIAQIMRRTESSIKSRWGYERRKLRDEVKTRPYQNR